MSEPLTYLNGRFIPQSQAHLALNDAGFIFGATVTDLCRTFRHQLFRLEDHVIRFRASCEHAQIPQPLPDGELILRARELVDPNARFLAPEQDLALVLFATPGEIGYYLGQPGGPGDGSPTLCLHTFPLPFRRYARLFEEGAHLIVPPTRRLPPECVSPLAKHRSRLHWWRAEREVHEADPAASALLLDIDGHVTETATANFIIVRGGKVLSPSRRRILGGISLRVVEELCGELGEQAIPFEEADLVLDDCLKAEEAMLTSTSFCIAPVSRINDIPIPCPGPVFGQLLAAWSQRVGLDIRRQICGA